MDVLPAALVGACGGVLYELVVLARFLSARGHFPWSPRGHRRVVRVRGELRRYESSFVYLVAVTIRGAVGAVVAGALSQAGGFNLLAALVAGTGAYSIVDSWATSVPVHDGKTQPLVATDARAGER